MTQATSSQDQAGHAGEAAPPRLQKRRRFTRKILGISFILIAVSFGSLGAWVYSASRDAVMAEIEGRIRSTGVFTADGIQKWLEGRTLLVRGLSDDIAAVGGASAATRALVNRKGLGDTFSTAYFGVASSGEFITSNLRPLPAGYDPRKRPWNEAAAKAADVVMTRPYVDASTHRLVVTVAGSVTIDQRLLGVAGSDLPLDTLTDYLQSVDLDGKGYVFLVDAEGVVLVHPDKDRIMKPSGIDPASAQSRTLGVETGTMITRFFPINGLPTAKWYVGVSLDSTKVFAPLRSLALVLVLSVIGTMMLVLVLLGLLIVRLVSRPISEMTRTMTAVSGGELDIAIPNLGRRDEIGAMAGAVMVFRDGMQTAVRLAAERSAEQERASTDKLAALLHMAETIEGETGSALERIRLRTTAMTTTADAMTASAGRTGSAAETAAGAAGLALANAQTVASAADQLSASIREISGQIARSNEIVGRAVAAGSETRGTIETLNEQVARIGAVADMIGEIAAKTNLLALNATIEAARAGDAGKGFAVVAAEVKALATQTARSTQEISQHIGHVRNATSASVAAVTQIEQTIGEISAIAGSIAAAVEEQGAATAEIARNVTETASATDAMTARITEVSDEAGETGRQADEVRENVTGLNAAMEELRHSVIRVVRTSTIEVDRRAAHRHDVDLPCQLTIGGQTHRARVKDLSEGGASVSGIPALQAGVRGSIDIEGVGFPVPVTVKLSDGGSAHLAFVLDAATAARFSGIPDRLARRRAA